MLGGCSLKWVDSGVSVIVCSGQPAVCSTHKVYVITLCTHEKTMLNHVSTISVDIALENTVP